MKNAIASLFSHRATTVVACSAAVLLTACGGDIAGASTATLSHGVQSANASDAAAADVQVAALTEDSAGTGAFEQAAAAPQSTRLLATISSAT
jgi:hypothetical protein